MIPLNKIVNSDEVIPEGHLYELTNFENPDRRGQILAFICKEKIDEAGNLRTVFDGTTNEDLIKVLVHRLGVMNAKFPCRENSIVVTHLETALLWLEKRTADRKARGVEGKHKA